MEPGEVLRICSDPRALESLRFLLLVGLIITGALWAWDAWKAADPKNANRAQMFKGRREPWADDPEDPICPLHRVVASKCEDKHRPAPQDGTEEDPED